MTQPAEIRPPSRNRGSEKQEAMVRVPHITDEWLLHGPVRRGRPKADFAWTRMDDIGPWFGWLAQMHEPSRILDAVGDSRKGVPPTLRILVDRLLAPYRAARSGHVEVSITAVMGSAANALVSPTPRRNIGHTVEHTAVRGRQWQFVPMRYVVGVASADRGWYVEVRVNGVTKCLWHKEYHGEVVELAVEESGRAAS